VTRYGKAGQEIHGKAGTVMAVAFELEGQAFTALNGGPLFKFNEAISLQLMCAKLSEGGDKKAQQCGWLKDKLAFHGRSFPRSCSTCSVTPTPRNPRGRWRPCCR
jgi:predicted 3-demethylubiquinone-9 3-methyltransferase (glyoxalase superfamily)